jgi:hypothetical protein
VLVLLVSGAAAETITGLRAAEPQPTQLTPGLYVEYTYGMVNNLEQLKGRKFEAGPPLESINYRWSGNVLTSKVREGVAPRSTGSSASRSRRVRLRGHLERRRARRDRRKGAPRGSRDPLRQHIDRIDVKIDTPGWYPLKIVYFQKKGTASWCWPGSDRARRARRSRFPPRPTGT